MSKRFFAALAVVALAGLSVQAAAEEGMDGRLKAERYAAEIIEMRSSLARTFIKPGMEITEETFKKVCGAVGKRVQEMTAEGVVVRHAAVKYRNPRNEATAEETELIGEFDRDRDFKEMWDTATVEGKSYLRYTRPIFVEDACLACHGPAETRPAWIAEKYPTDRAYDFNSGDIRGIVSVMAPEE